MAVAHSSPGPETAGSTAARPSAARPTARVARPRASVEEEVARARISFLAEDRLPDGVVRRPILASWTRSRLFRVRPDRLELELKPDLDDDTLLTRAAGPVLRQIADLFATEPVSVVLCDPEGVVLDRLTGDSGLERHLDRVSLAPGFSYAEQRVGTNGIGTALEAGGPAHVFGHEHYAERLEALACAGVPIRHPVTGKTLGVVDLTCWQRDAGALLVATAGTLAHRIEEELAHLSRSREVAVIQDYLAACRRNRGPVIALGDDLFMMNDQARALIEPADQETLLAEAREALATDQRHAILVDLPSGGTARVLCRPTVDGLQIVGGVLDVQLGSNAPAVEPRPPLGGSVTLASAAGNGGAWRRCLLAASRHLQAGEWLVLEGEPGSGRGAVAHAAHLSHRPTRRLHVISAADHGSHLVRAVVEEISSGAGTLVLEDVDLLPQDVVAELVAVLDEYRERPEADGFWLVATTSPGGDEPSPQLAALLACFPCTVAVPPLRRHVEDLPELVPQLLARLGRGSGVTVSPEAMRVLMRNRWPGNVDQLIGVLRRILGRRRSGVITLQDLPAECWVTGKRQLTPLESLECDAIVEALWDSQGNKVAAARRLSMSRATIYRKIRDYGITLPDPAPRVGGG
jgi:transcriptional regulator of acetoin/glycerol metabolism